MQDSETRQKNLRPGARIRRLLRNAENLTDEQRKELRDIQETVTEIDECGALHLWQLNELIVRLNVDPRLPPPGTKLL